MTENPRRYHVGITSVLRRCLALTLLTAGAAQAGVADRLAGYVTGCEAALLAGDVSAFADLGVETETVTETVEVFGWRDGDLVVSLLARVGGAKRTGVCDVSYSPADVPEADLTQIALLSDHMATTAMTKPHKLETAMAGQVILTCAGDRGMALFLDPAAVGTGFAAQVATVPPHRMGCGG